jgi:hypothetical protein
VMQMRTFKLRSLASNWRQPQSRHSNPIASLRHRRRMASNRPSAKVVGSSGSRDPSGGNRMQCRPRVVHIVLLSIPSAFTLFHDGS